MIMILGGIEFKVEYSSECDCNQAYIIGGPYNKDKLALVIEELENNFGVIVVF